jgi:hypothetical protein
LVIPNKGRATPNGAILAATRRARDGSQRDSAPCAPRNAIDADCGRALWDGVDFAHRGVAPHSDIPDILDRRALRCAKSPSVAAPKQG